MLATTAIVPTWAGAVKPRRHDVIGIAEFNASSEAIILEGGRCSIPSAGLVAGARIAMIYPYDPGPGGGYPVSGEPLAFGIVKSGKPIASREFPDEPTGCRFRFIVEDLPERPIAILPASDAIDFVVETLTLRELRNKSWKVELGNEQIVSDDL